MSKKKIYLYAHEASSLLVSILMLVVLYKVHQPLALLIGGIYCLKNAFAIMYKQQQELEDDEVMEQFEKMLRRDEEK